MPTLTEFYSQISSELRRGSSLDSLIPAKLRQSVRIMENLRTWRHMRHFATVSMDTGSTQPRALSQPTGFKRMEFWRIDKGDGQGFRYLTMVNPKDVSKTEEAMPTSFWMDGVDYFWFDNTPDEDYETEMGYDAYTVLSTTGSDSPTIIQNFESVLLHGTCMLFAGILRDAKFLEIHKEQLDIALKAAVDADVEALQGNESLSVQYGWEFREQVNEGVNYV